MCLPTACARRGAFGRDSLYGRCQKISAAETKPGDLIFFEKTIPGEDGITHVGIYVDAPIHSALPDMVIDHDKPLDEDGELYETNVPCFAKKT